MYAPADCPAATTMISDFNPVRDLNNVTRTETTKMLEDSDVPIRVRGLALRLFREKSKIAEWDKHLRRRREAVRIEAGKYLELRKKAADPRQSLDFNPAAEERDRLRALFEQELSNISGQLEHIERYVQFGEKYRGSIQLNLNRLFNIVSMHSSVGYPVVLKTLLKSLLRFN